MLIVYHFLQSALAVPAKGQFEVSQDKHGACKAWTQTSTWTDTSDWHHQTLSTDQPTKSGPTLLPYH